jgi:hypothetical protein
VWVGPNAHGKPAPPVRDPTGRIRPAGSNAFDPVPIYYVAPATSVLVRDDGTPPIGANVEKTIARALADAQRGYRIGYDPPPENWDGRYHGVRITCTRPGVTIRAGAGYAAVRPVDIADDQRQVVPDMVEVSPFDASAIRFRAAAVPDSTAPQFDLHVNAEDVLFRRGNKYSCALAVLAIRYTEAGELEIPQEGVLLNLNLTPETRTAALRDGIPIRLTAGAAAPAARFRLVVYDRATRSFGTLTVPAREVSR